MEQGTETVEKKKEVKEMEQGTETVEKKKGMEKMIVPEPLKKLRRWAISVVVCLLLLAAAVFYINHTAEKRVEAEFKAIVEEQAKRIAELEDRPAIVNEVSKEVNLSVLNSQIQSIGELSTMEYLYTDAGQYSDSKQVWKIKLPGTTKSFVAKWDGTIKAGVDVTKITLEKDEGKKVITVHMPNAQILSHEIDNDSIETLDENNGVFNPVRVEDVRSFDAASQEEMEKRALERGLLEKAEENAQALIEELLKAALDGEELYTIEFVLDVE